VIAPKLAVGVVDVVAIVVPCRVTTARVKGTCHVIAPNLAVVAEEEAAEVVVVAEEAAVVGKEAVEEVAEIVIRRPLKVFVQ
jgi:hypothetical protein